MEYIINTDKVCKSYDKLRAVKDVSLHIKKGEIYGFLGLNGAGKTTMIRMLLGMIKPTSGEIYIQGKKLHKGSLSLLHKTGYLVETPYAYPNLTVRENLRIYSELRFLYDKKIIEEVLELLSLTKYANVQAKHLSLGNAQRLGLAKALLHSPEILILDEPTNGLDPAGIYEIRELLFSLAKDQGITIFVSSHILSEMSRFATRIGIIHNGAIIQEFDQSKLHSLSEKQLIINTLDNSRAMKIFTQNKIHALYAHNNELLITENKYIEKPELIAELLVKQDVAPNKLYVHEEDLETYFLRTIHK